jgi:hypothetical protein
MNYRKNRGIEYIFFYLFLALFFSLYSVSLDFLFILYEGGKLHNVHPWLPLWYLYYFIVGYGYINIPIFIVYNFVVNNIPFKNNAFRILFGFTIGLATGFLAKDSLISAYIGTLRPLKRIVVCCLIGISVELTRSIKERMVKKRLGKAIV